VNSPNSASAAAVARPAPKNAGRSWRSFLLFEHAGHHGQVLPAQTLIDGLLRSEYSMSLADGVGLEAPIRHPDRPSQLQPERGS
jgi:hypothetical protein